MSGIDEQRKTEMRVRMFYSFQDLLKVLEDDDVERGEILFLDEDYNSVSDKVRLENLRRVGREKKVIVCDSIGMIREVNRLIKRVGLEEFWRQWFG